MSEEDFYQSRLIDVGIETIGDTAPPYNQVMRVDILVGALAGRIQNVANTIPNTPVMAHYRPIAKINHLAESIDLLMATDIKPFVIHFSNDKNYYVKGLIK